MEEIIVYTAICEFESRKAFLGYHMDPNFWYMVIDVRYIRDIKKYMKAAKKRIQLEKYYETGIKPTINFLVRKMK